MRFRKYVLVFTTEAPASGELWQGKYRTQRNPNLPFAGLQLVELTPRRGDTGKRKVCPWLMRWILNENTRELVLPCRVSGP